MLRINGDGIGYLIDCQRAERRATFKWHTTRISIRSLRVTDFCRAICMTICPFNARAMRAKNRCKNMCTSLPYSGAQSNGNMKIGHSVITQEKSQNARAHTENQRFPAVDSMTCTTSATIAATATTPNYILNQSTARSVFYVSAPSQADGTFSRRFSADRTQKTTE